MKRNTSLLLAGVVSYPKKRVDAINDRKALEDYVQWGKLVLKFLKSEFGNRLCSVVNHVDEEYLHFHFYVIPNFSAGESNLVQAHPGMLAAAKAVPPGYKGHDAGKLKNDAFKKAMREFQDQFYTSVSMHMGHARRGPGKRRLTRAQWRAEQQQAEALKKVNDEKALAMQAFNRAGQARIAEMERQAENRFKQDRENVGRLIKTLMQSIASLKERGRAVPDEAGDVIKDAEAIFGSDYSQNP